MNDDLKIFCDKVGGKYGEDEITELTVKPKTGEIFEGLINIRYCSDGDFEVIEKDEASAGIFNDKKRYVFVRFMKTAAMDIENRSLTVYDISGNYFKLTKTEKRK